MTDWSSLDRQMQKWGPRLRDDLNIIAGDTSRLATVISREVASITPTVRAAIRSASPVSVDSRLDELTAFQMWMEMSAASAVHPAITRARVLTQNYLCFVYLKEAWFDALVSYLPASSVTSKCSAFLLSDDVRRFRNGFAHGNWCYLADFSGLEYWARAKGSGNTELRSVVNQLDLEFWQTLSRCTAYASMQTLVASAP